MPSTSFTLGWWSASPPTQVSLLSFPSTHSCLLVVPLRTIPQTAFFCRLLRLAETVFKHSDEEQGPIRKIGSGHGKWQWGISKTTPLTNTSPADITLNGEKLQLLNHVCLLPVSATPSSLLARVHAGAVVITASVFGTHRQILVLHNLSFWIVKLKPLHDWLKLKSFVLQRLRPGCTVESGR
jgi:hypothetical protein